MVVKASYATLLVVVLCRAAAAAPSTQDTVLVEAESFGQLGGWALDTQFIQNMGSPYLLAHGLGTPVADAVTTVKFPGPGTYRVFVRTKDWVAPWKAPGAPGKFQLIMDGHTVPTIFGTTGADWGWQAGGTVKVGSRPVQVALRDLTGFDGRCDAVLFTRNASFVPPNDHDVLPQWRRRLLKVTANARNERSFDLVVVGGGYAGTGAAIAASRMGLKVALVQDRFVLGGNGSSEVRVWAQGKTPDGLYPVADIINEISDHATSSPGRAEEFGDVLKDRIVRAEENLSLFLGQRAFAVEMAKGKRISAVQAVDVKTSQVTTFRAPFFVDATGHGFIGMWAGADRVMQPGGRMGMSNMWRWENTEGLQTFPDAPWALELGEQDFPYPRRFHAEWFWEGGFDKHPLDDLELIRDWNLRAVFGAWQALKKGDAYGAQDPQQHKNARLTWVAYVGGTRETQQLLGDVVLSKDDILAKRVFPDAAVLTTWDLDLHEPAKRYAKRYPENPYISMANFGKGVDRKNGYPIPYRCFYSRNIENLFVAGRNVSVTHEALGTVRVMKTLGMIGVVVGKAAAVAIEQKTTPRGVYEQHLGKLIEFLKLPGSARRPRLASNR